MAKECLNYFVNIFLISSRIIYSYIKNAIHECKKISDEERTTATTFLQTQFIGDHFQSYFQKYHIFCEIVLNSLVTVTSIIDPDNNHKQNYYWVKPDVHY